AHERIVAGAAGERVIPGAPVQRVIARPAVQAVIAGPAGKGVVAGPAGDAVVETVAGADEIARAGQSEILDLGAKRVGEGRRLHRVGARGQALGDAIADSVDELGGGA